MSVAPAVLLDGTCLVPLRLKDSGGNTVWQVNAAGNIGVGGADISSGLYAFRSVANAATLSLMSVENTNTLGTSAYNLAGDGGQGGSLSYNGSGQGGATLTALPAITRLVGGTAAGLLLHAFNAAGPITFATGGNALTNRRWQMSSAGHLLAFADNTFDIGASGANQPRNVYVAGAIGVNGADISSGLYVFRSVNNGAAAKAVSIENSDPAGVLVLNMTGPAGSGALTYTNSGGAGTFATNIASSCRVSGSGTGGLLVHAQHASGAITFITGGGNLTNRRWQIPSTGHLLAFADNTYDIGASGANRPRDLYVARDVSFAGLPTSDPAVAGRLWRSGNTVMVSTG